MKPAITQISTLANRLSEEDWIKVQFNTEEIFDAIKDITRNQYSYIYALLFNKRALKLREVLISIGLKPKQ